jgi:hypothetical protein
VNLRWYKSQLDLLPPDSRKRLSNQLRRAMRVGGLPSRREWRQTIQQVMGSYRPSMNSPLTYYH